MPSGNLQTWEQNAQGFQSALALLEELLDTAGSSWGVWSRGEQVFALVWFSLLVLS